MQVVCYLGRHTNEVLGNECVFVIRESAEEYGSCGSVFVRNVPVSSFGQHAEYTEAFSGLPQKAHANAA